MAERSGFFDANYVNEEYDRVYLAESFAKYFENFISNGVFGEKLNKLQVVQSDTPDMSVKISTGKALIKGYWYENTSNLSFNIAASDSVLNRIDIIVLRLDMVGREITAKLIKGTAASEPVAPSITRQGDVYELKLAEIYIEAGTEAIMQNDITDTRANPEVCGFVTNSVEYNEQIYNLLTESIEVGNNELDEKTIIETDANGNTLTTTYKNNGTFTQVFVGDGKIIPKTITIGNGIISEVIE